MILSYKLNLIYKRIVFFENYSKINFEIFFKFEKKLHFNYFILLKKKKKNNALKLNNFLNLIFLSLFTMFS